MNVNDDIGAYVTRRHDHGRGCRCDGEISGDDGG